MTYVIIINFRFPKEPNAREQWIDVTGRENWMPTKTSTICSKHFTENDFIIKKSGYRYLKPGAIPREQIVKICSCSLVSFVFHIAHSTPIFYTPFIINKSDSCIQNVRINSFCFILLFIFIEYISSTYAIILTVINISLR